MNTGTLTKALAKMASALLFACCVWQANAQVIVYTDIFTNGVQATPAQVTAWNNFRASLIALPYFKVKVTGSVGPTIKECNVPAIVQDIALKLRTLPGPVTTNAFSWVDGVNTWQVGTDISGRFGVNMTSLSNCDNPGHVIKPGISNSNWGGWGTATCGGPTQTITIEFWYGPPCTTPSGLTASNILSTSATVSWAAVPSSAGYEYEVNTTAADPTAAGTATSLTTANVSGLMPSTTYYLHVRNKCSATSISSWVTYSFTTLPPCKFPVGFNVTNLTPVSATINWAAWPSAISYDYIVDQSNATPSSSAPATNTLGTAANVGSLLENTWYYVHIRSKCAAGEQSDWSLDSFLTPILCRPPVVNVSYINTSQAVVYWAPVPTALYYEYAITTSATPPAQGTKYNFTSLHTSALHDGEVYYFHIRSHCSSLNIETTSDWGVESFKTFPTTVKNTAGNSFNLLAYPNPVKDKLTLKVMEGDGDAFVTITDISGKALQQLHINPATATDVDFSLYAPGVYLMKYDDQSHHEVIRLSK